MSKTVHTARLVAYGPEILEAMRRCYKLLDQVIIGDDPDAALADMERVMRTAIAKAEGLE